MTKENIEELITDLNAMILSGKSHEAFERYYDDNVVMQENEMVPTFGKEANRLREIEFNNNVEAFRKAEVLGVATGTDISYVTWRYDFTHRLWGVRNYTQVSVQQWKNGKIVREQFFYGN